MTPSRWIILFLAITMFLCRFMFVEGASLQYENQMIERLDVEVINLPDGVCFDVNTIKTRIKCKEGSLFCQSEFDNDLKTLAKDFDRIEPVLDCVEGKIFITLNIWPKPTIRNVVWKGNNRICGDDLETELGIPRGSVFDRLAFNTSFHKLKTYYVTNGFFEAEVDYAVIPVIGCNQVDIEITVCEGRAGRIQRIDFCNFTEEEIEYLSENILTKKYNLFTSFLTEEGTYREEAIHQDEFTILNYLQNKGYADAKVWIEVRESCVNRLSLRIMADKGEIYYFGKLTIAGNKIFCDDDIWNRIRICEGQEYSPDRLRLAADRVADYMGKYGYIDAVVDFEPKVSTCAEYTYDVDFTIEEDEQFRIGLIKVLGNCSTQTSVILHESFLIPGEVFNIEKLKATEERLTNIGYFSSVNVYAVKTDAACGLGKNYRDVHIEVEETSTGEFGASLGFSSQESVFGTFSITERNFNSAGLPDFWSKGMSALRGGGEFTQFSATIGLKSRSYDFSWTKPYFLDSKWTVGYEIESSSNRYISDDYTINTLGYTLRGAYPINAFVKAMVHYRILHTDIDIDVGDIKRGAAHDYEEAAGYQSEGDVLKAKADQINEKTHPTEKAALNTEANKKFRDAALKRNDARDKLTGLDKIIEETRNSGLLSAIGTSLMYDSTNNPCKPTKGFKSRFEVEYAGIGGKHTFFSFSYLNFYYWQFRSFDETGIWRFRADARFIQPIGSTEPHTIPIEERYFLGGAYVIRGYRPFRLGPQFEEGDPRGGISLQFLSLEYSRPLFKRLELFVFADSGHLSLDRWSFGRMSTSVGAGFRIALLPNSAPLVLGMGFPIDPQNRSEVKKFFIELGGQF